MTPRSRVLEVEDPSWDTVVGHIDPYAQRDYLRALAVATGVRPVLVEIVSPGWRGVYPILLRELGSDRWLGRSTEYGGPQLVVSGPTPLEAASELRQQLDRVLRGLGVVSEVAVLAPWLPHQRAIRSAWSARRDKAVSIASVHDLAGRWGDLPKGRRSDIRAGERSLAFSWERFSPGHAADFARRYADAMERLDADGRWRLDVGYFCSLAGAARETLWLATAQSAEGGSSGLFLVGEAWASYLFATRWGAGKGTATLVWNAQRALAERGVESLLLGGGLTGADDDPLLAFKASLADRSEAIWLAGRLFDAAEHDRAVRDGRARALPGGTVHA